MSRWVVHRTRGIRRRRIQKGGRYSTITPYGLENISRPIADDCGVMIASNHSAHFDSEAIYCALDKIDQPTFIITAWQIFGCCSFWQQWLLQGIGCFSIDREGSDRNAYRESIRILRKEKHPLLIFPEGDIFHTNDRITRFREGMGAIALSAAKHEERPVVVVPCAVKFWFLDDPRPGLRRVLTRLEKRLTLHPKPRLPLVARINRIATAALSLKEIEYCGQLTTGSMHERISRLIRFILEQLESTYGKPIADDETPGRVKNLRQAVITKLEAELAASSRNERAINQCRLHMEDLFTVMQLWSYPEDYLDDNPSIERIAETIDKLEEDIDFVALPTVHGRKRVDVSFGEPIPVEVTRDRTAATRLATVTHDRVQEMIDRLPRLPQRN